MFCYLRKPIEFPQSNRLVFCGISCCMQSMSPHRRQSFLSWPNEAGQRNRFTLSKHVIKLANLAIANLSFAKSRLKADGPFVMMWWPISCWVGFFFIESTLLISTKFFKSSKKKVLHLSLLLSSAGWTFGIVLVLERVVALSTKHLLTSVSHFVGVTVLSGSPLCRGHHFVGITTFSWSPLCRGHHFVGVTTLSGSPLCYVFLSIHFSVCVGVYYKLELDDKLERLRNLLWNVKMRLKKRIFSNEMPYDGT